MDETPVRHAWEKYRGQVIKGEPSPQIEEWFRMTFYGGASFMFSTMMALLLKNMPPETQVYRELALAWRLIELEFEQEADEQQAKLRMSDGSR